MHGFYTQEIRESGRRVGFELVTLEGQRGIMAHTDIRDGPHVGKYGVDLQVIESLAVPAMERGMDNAELLILDEIGPMELKSSRFRQTALQVLEHPVHVLGSMVLRPHPFSDSLKARKDLQVVHMHKSDWDAYYNRVHALILDQVGP
jgi:nucleoside-triphosphatase